MELIDIVDEDDNVLYQIEKDDAHKKGLLHRTVVAGIRCRDQRIILVKQTPKRQDPGQFVSPVGGHVRAGESIVDANILYLCMDTI